MATAPRLASILREADHSGEPMMVTSYHQGLSQASSTMMASGNPLSQWCAKVTQGQREQSQADAAEQRAQVVQAQPAPESRTVFSPVADIYKRLRGEEGAVSRLQTKDEIAESLRPAAAGETADALQSEPKTREERNEEMVGLTALIVGSGYGDQVDRDKTKGAFDATVFSNVFKASTVIAPGKAPSQMTEGELKSVIAATIVASNASYVHNMQASGNGAVPKQFADAAKATPDAGKVASEFTKDGTFSESQYKEKTDSAAMQAAKLAGATPLGLKMQLLVIAGEKAQELTSQYFEKHSEWRDAMVGRVTGSIDAKVDAMRDSEGMGAPGAGGDDDGERRKKLLAMPSAGHPTIPGAR